MATSRVPSWLACLAAALLFGGCMMTPDNRPRVVIEFGVEPAELEGIPVEIDDRVVGTLKKFGEATRTTFPVSKGEHVVRVRHPRFDCQPAKVAAELATQRILLVLNFAETSATGKPTLVFQY